jgi:hypothetical protein
MTPNLSHTVATLERAESEVAAAEQELVNLLSAIRVAPRAEKTSVSQIVEVALRRLRSALVSVEGAKTELAAVSGPPSADKPKVAKKSRPANAKPAWGRRRP